MYYRGGNMTVKEKIQLHLSNIYCDDCKFNDGEEAYWKSKLGYYGCDGCVRKSMGWEPSDSCIQEIIKIVKVAEEV